MFNRFNQQVSYAIARAPWLLLVLAFFLSSCSHVQKDGPPNFYVDETRIGNAIPKLEKRSRFGNKTYTIHGKTYRILNSSENYNEIGKASWYGTKFHKKRTSSGERYNMLAMTAAHRTLPLPTYVYVTNLRNGKKIIVKINDRGPFHSNRLIDLSFVAAKKLGMTGHGTTLVRVSAIPPQHYRALSAPAPTFPTASVVYLQIASYSELNRAERLKNQLKHLIRSAPVLIRRNAWLSGNYLVQVGPVSDVKTYKRVNKHLKRLGFTPLLVRA